MLQIFITFVVLFHQWALLHRVTYVGCGVVFGGRHDADICGLELQFVHQVIKKNGDLQAGQ